MSLDECIKEWRSKNRRMGCVSAADFVCKRVPGFQPERLTRYTSEGDVFQHVGDTDGFVRVDLAPYSDKPRDD